MNDLMVTVAGNLVDDVKLRTFPDGSEVASFRLAHNARRFDRETSEWTDSDSSYFWVNCWRSMARNVYDSLRKGMPIVVTGRLRQKEYDRETGGVTYRATSLEIDAHAIGPDVAKGIATFRRVKAAAVVRQEDRSRSDAFAAVEGPQEVEVADPESTAA
jgi:single-strand DNA-binding protein